MSRRKAPAIDIPQSIEDAKALATGYAANVGSIEAIEAERKIRIAEVNADCDARIKPRSESERAKFLRLKGWWEANGATLAKGRRSTVFAGLSIGFRMTPTALKLPKGKPVAKLIDRLIELFGGDYLITKNELDRRAIVAHLQRPESKLDEIGLYERQALLDVGFTTAQRDEFFVEVLPKGEGE